MTSLKAPNNANAEALDFDNETIAYNDKSTIPKVSILPGHFTNLIEGNTNFQNKVQCNFERDDGSLDTPSDYGRAA